MNFISSLSLLCTAVVCLQVTGSSPTLDQHQLELKQHYEHLAYIAGFKCHTPQPRAIPIHQLFLDSEINGKAYFPDVTVLHHCNCETGTCMSGHTCGPELSDSIVLPFKVTFLENIEQHKKGSWIMEYHTLVNHTQCACLEDGAAVVPEQTTAFTTSFNEIAV